MLRPQRRSTPAATEEPARKQQKGKAPEKFVKKAQGYDLILNPKNPTGYKGVQHEGSRYRALYQCYAPYAKQWLGMV